MSSLKGEKSSLVFKHLWGYDVYLEEMRRKFMVVTLLSHRTEFVVFNLMLMCWEVSVLFGPIPWSFPQPLPQLYTGKGFLPHILCNVDFDWMSQQYLRLLKNGYTVANIKITGIRQLLYVLSPSLPSLTYPSVWPPPFLSVTYLLLPSPLPYCS